MGVIEHGHLAYAKGFGSANLDHRIPISPDSVFNVASLSKQFTAACAGLLITRGRLSLDSEVREFIPEFPERFGSVEIQHLIYMTSGLPEYYRTAWPGGRNWDLDYFTFWTFCLGRIKAARRTGFVLGGSRAIPIMGTISPIVEPPCWRARHRIGATSSA